jgi:hypothetical protein
MVRDMGRRLTLRLGPFEREALDRYGNSQRVSAVQVIRTAVLYYLRERDSDRLEWRMPELARAQPGGATAVELEVEVDEETWRSLVEEAAAQSTDSETLARHALLFFLADVDSGRIAGKLARVVRLD